MKELQLEAPMVIDQRQFSLANSYSRAINLLLDKNPFYAIFLMNTLKEEEQSSAFPYAAVTITGGNTKLLLAHKHTLDIPQPDGTVVQGSYGFLSLPLNEQVGVLMHEVLHLANEHLPMFSDPESWPDRKLLNIACDLEINQSINRFMLPPEGIFLDSYPHFNLPPFAGSVVYYDLLKKEQDIIKQKKEENRCAGLPEDNGLNSSQQALDSQGDDPSHMVIMPEDGEGNSIDGQQFWDTWKVLNNAKLEEAYKQCVDTIGESKTRGLIPGHLLNNIDKLLTPREPVTNWRGAFRRFVGNSQKRIAKKTRRKDSIRFPGMAAIKYKRTCDILVCLDTSGSVSDLELQNFISELDNIYRRGDVCFDIACCDAAIASVVPYKKGQSFLEIKGRGGTDFNPAIKLMNENPKYSALVYFTDGECYPPDLTCPQPLLWVFSRPGKYDNFPGYHVLMEIEK